MIKLDQNIIKWDHNMLKLNRYMIRWEHIYDQMRSLV